MYKFFFVVFICAFSFQLNAQYKTWTEAKIFMKDSTVLEGHVILPYGSVNEKVRFKTDPKKVSDKIPAKSIDKMILIIEYSEKVKGKRVKRIREATYIVIQNDKKGKNFGFAELLIDGKLKLVKRVIETSNGSQFNLVEGIETLFVRPNERAEVFSHLSLKKFSKRAAEYFQDCPNLVSKIEKEKLNRKHLREIASYYNSNCGL